MKAEYYKLRTHRVPVACAALLLIASLIPSVVLIWYTPSDPGVYADAYRNVFNVAGFILAAVFGAWLLGTEYSQGTVKRLLASEPRRARALAKKAVVGVDALAGTVLIVGGIAWVAARIVGSMHDVTVAWEPRAILGDAIAAVVVGTVAFGISAITRSFGYAMIATVAFVSVVDGLMRIIPKVGKYSLGTASGWFEAWVAGRATDIAELSVASASIALTAWLALFIGGAFFLFTTRDV